MYKLHRFILPLCALAFLLGGCSRSTPPADNTASGSSLSSESSMSPVSFDGKILSGKHTVLLQTSMGDITIEVDADAAPKTATNFYALAKAGYFDNLTFHRVIPSFMIQGGDPTGDGTGGQSVFGETFEDEINAESYDLHKKKLADIAQGQPIPDQWKDMTLKEYYEMQGYSYNDDLKSLPIERGVVAMANRGPNTNGSQFFIVQGKDVGWLEGKYTVFGKVTDGMSAVDAIANVQRDPSDKPLTPVTFTAKAQ
jgi:cyclophilin family peptidyl-prolyl cis-trans isomerase